MSPFTTQYEPFDYSKTFYAVVLSLYHNEVMVTNTASLSRRVMWFKAAEELYKLGYGTDYSTHPGNPLNENPHN